MRTERASRLDTLGLLFCGLAVFQMIAVVIVAVTVAANDTTELEPSVTGSIQITTRPMVLEAVTFGIAGLIAGLFLYAMGTMMRVVADHNLQLAALTSQRPAATPAAPTVTAAVTVTGRAGEPGDGTLADLPPTPTADQGIPKSAARSELVAVARQLNSEAMARRIDSMFTSLDHQRAVMWWTAGYHRPGEWIIYVAHSNDYRTVAQVAVGTMATIERAGRNLPVRLFTRDGQPGAVIGDFDAAPGIERARTVHPILAGGGIAGLTSR